MVMEDLKLITPSSWSLCFESGRLCTQCYTLSLVLCGYEAKGDEVNNMKYPLGKKTMCV